ncbi:hypothetical protein M2404_003833 [Rheinheimera pacifica]|uniref:hypothetical protein n=1 Tax=Rheinheimera pacifica TaxID=173990 RepID=UPI0021676A2C|nr:hypothetical protein [Rheinheimera pacifica]MCS4309461.1 hypothetical protein [Rheinheimera pacifica]
MDNLHSIVDAQNNVIEDELSLSQAEQRLSYYVSHGEDYYITDYEPAEVFSQVTNAVRADWAHAAVQSHTEAAGIEEEPPYAQLNDLLCNLGHWAKSQGIDYAAAFKSALLLYEIECAEDE